MESFQQQALGFQMPTADFDPNQTPEDGEQYLQRVVYERANCPAVVARPFKIKKTNSSLTYPTWNKMLTDDIIDTAPSFLLPTKEWVRMQQQSFSFLRDQISALRIKYNEQNAENLDLNLPSEDDSDLWLQYCQHNKPLLSTMFCVTQRTLELLIEYQSQWLSDDLSLLRQNLSWLSPWIYSSLACLHLPLEPNMHSILRDIAKTCIRLRNNMSNDDFDTVLPLNLLISIVSHNFNQLDLCGRTQ